MRETQWDETAGNLEPKTCCSGVTSLNWESRRFQIKPVPVNGLLFGRDSRILSPAQPRTSNLRGIRLQLPLLKDQTARGARSTNRGNNHRTIRSRVDSG